MKRILILFLLLTMEAHGAISLVGTIGVTSQGAANTAVTPAWGTGESRTTGNLLICFVGTTAQASGLSAPAGWSLGVQQNSSVANSYVFYRIATGADAAPTIPAISPGGIAAAQLAEFSGNSATPLDKSGSAVGSSSPITATFGAADTASGELLIIASADSRSAARTPNDTLTSNNATITQAGNNNGVSSANHYSFGYALATTSNAAADTAIMTASVTTSISSLSVVGATFKAAAVVPPANPSAFLQFF